MSRAVWDLRYTLPPSYSRGNTQSYPISALYGNTPAEPLGPLVAPGDYEVRLTANGVTVRQPLHVVMEPRVKTSPQGIAAQRDLGLLISAGMTVSHTANEQVAALRAALAELKSPPEPAGAAIARAATFGGAAGGRGGRGGGGGGRGGGGATANFMTLNGEFGSQMTNVEQGDYAPTLAMQETYRDSCTRLATAVSQWEEFKSKDLAALNSVLGAASVSVPPPVPAPPSCGK